MGQKLTTPEAYNKMTPWQQGYVTYMEAAHPGSQIPKKCPYERGTKERERWDEGAQHTVLIAQDCDD